MVSINHSGYELFPSPKRVRVILKGQVIVDSWSAVLLLHENGLPVYYFPPEDIRTGVLSVNGLTEVAPGRGRRRYFNVTSNGSTLRCAAWDYIGLEPPLCVLGGYVAFKWEAMDAWFEEDDEIYVHARDPYKRIDTNSSSSLVRVRLDGETVAESNRCVILYETGIEPRYYLPKLDVRLDLLVPSTHVTYCPYKGEARYYSLRRGCGLLEDVVWYYRYPIAGVTAIAGRLGFYQERIEVEVDGERV